MSYEIGNEDWFIWRHLSTLQTPHGRGGAKSTMTIAFFDTEFFDSRGRSATAYYMLCKELLDQALQMKTSSATEEASYTWYRP